MKTIPKLLMLSAIAMTVIIGCKKERISTLPPSSNTSSGTIGDFFSRNGASLQTFTISSTAYQTVQGSKGTRIYINPNSFVTQANQPVTGNVTIELKEIFSKKDMILSKAPTTSKGRSLISGGEIYLVAKQNDQKLKLTNNSNVWVDIPGGINASANMNEFYASNLDGNSDWNVLDTTTVIPVFQDSSNFGNYYSFEIDSMNWINCDYFYTSTGPVSNVMATVDNSFDTSNCFVFLSFNGQNSSAHCWSYSNHSFSPGAYYTLPIGMNVTFVAIALKNGQYYSAFKSSAIINNHNEVLNLTATTEAQINIDLANLP